LVVLAPGPGEDAALAAGAEGARAPLGERNEVTRGLDRLPGPSVRASATASPTPMTSTAPPPGATGARWRRSRRRLRGLARATTLYPGRRPGSDPDRAPDRHSLVAPIAVLLQGAHDHGLDAGGNAQLGTQAGGRSGFLGQDLGDDAEVVGGTEGDLARQALVRASRDRPDVGATVDVLAAPRLLGDM